MMKPASAQPSGALPTGPSGIRPTETPDPLAAEKAPRRTHEPVVWSLFGAGGVLSALFGPMLVLVTCILVPLGILLPPDTLSYARVLAFAQGWPGKLAILTVVSLFLFHAMHRFCHSLHDLGFHTGRGAQLLCYGFATLITVLCAAELLNL